MATSRFFGQFLLDRRIVDLSTLRRAVEYQNVRNKKIGELAVQRGQLSVSDAKVIHQDQRLNDSRFGAAAIQKGLLTPLQVDALLAEQKREHVHIGEALVAVGGLGMMELARELEAYESEERLQRARNVRARSSMPPTAGPVLWTAFEVTSRLLLRFADVITKEGTAWEDVNRLPPAEVEVCVPLVGDWTGHYFLRISRALARHVACRMHELEAPPSAEKCLAAAKELAHCACTQASWTLRAVHHLACEPASAKIIGPEDAALLQGRRIAVVPLEVMAPSDSPGAVEVAISPSK